MGGTVNDVRGARRDSERLAVRRTPRSDEDLQWEIELLQHLSANGLSVPELVATADGRSRRGRLASSGRRITNTPLVDSPSSTRTEELHTGTPIPTSPEHHRSLAIVANNSTWELLDGRELTAPVADDLLQRAYAAAYHWAKAAGTEPANSARASWLISRCHAALGHGEVALHHAHRCAAVVEEAGLVDFDLAYAHEATARALACLGRVEEALVERAAAEAVPIADEGDRRQLESDVAAGPWFGLDEATAAG